MQKESTALAIPTSTVTGSKSFGVKGNIPDEMFSGWAEKIKEVNHYEKMALDHLRASGFFKPYTNASNEHIVYENGSTNPMVKFSYRLSIEGNYAPKSQLNVQLYDTTLNLLLNSKILTVEEKRVMLKNRGIYIETTEYDNSIIDRCIEALNRSKLVDSAKRTAFYALKELKG